MAATHKNIFSAVTRAARKYWNNQDVTNDVKPPLVLNNEAISAVNAAGTGEVDLIKAGSDDIPELPTSGTKLTRPRVTTSIDDANGNEVIKTPATTSAVNEVTVTNAATGASPSVTTTGGDTNIGLKLGGKGTGGVIALGTLADFSTPATLTTAGNQTLTTAQLLGGLLLRDPNGGPVTDTTPTATQLRDALPHVVVGSTLLIAIRNTADAAEAITVAGGTGVTVSGTATIAQSNTKLFLLRFDNVSTPAATLYSLGTFVH